MLTDIFSARYGAVTLWDTFGEPERRLLVQAFRIVEEQLVPYWTTDGKVATDGEETWTSMHDRLTMELGVTELSQRGYYEKTTMFGNEHSVWRTVPILLVCRAFVCETYRGNVSADTFIKDRLSFVEIAFRDKERHLSYLNSQLPAQIAKAQHEATLPRRPRTFVLPGEPGAGLRAWNRQMNERFQQNVDELNERFRQASARLNYHNGIIQISEDEQVQRQIETPFWTLVADPIWKNVDTDMKEAIDLRDTAGRDPAFYAARALESAIKIISDRKGWTHGGEKGAHNYIENLFSKKNSFIERWEEQALKSIFTELRNPFGHGPGSGAMPVLSAQQTDWAIESCMAWIKSLIRRL